MNVTVNFIAGRLNNALVVPTTAIISKDGTGVLVPDAKKGPTFQEVTRDRAWETGHKSSLVCALVRRSLANCPKHQN